MKGSCKIIGEDPTIWVNLRLLFPRVFSSPAPPEARSRHPRVLFVPFHIHTVSDKISFNQTCILIFFSRGFDALAVMEAIRKKTEEIKQVHEKVTVLALLPPNQVPRSSHSVKLHNICMNVWVRFPHRRRQGVCASQSYHHTYMPLTHRKGERKGKKEPFMTKGRTWHKIK